MWTKEVVTLLIEAYKSQECLYNVKSIRYKNKNLRADALKDIVECLKPLVSVTEEEVKAKIANLRTVFLSEHGKHKRSMSSGAGVDDVYNPTSWYYHEMKFLVESSIPGEGVSNLRLEKITDEEEVVLFPEENFYEDGGSPAPLNSGSQRTVTPITVTPRGQEKKRKRESGHDNSVTRLAVKGLQDIGTVLQGLAAERKEKESNPNVHLARYIQSKLESYTDANLRLEVEQNLIQVLFDADVKATLMRECDTSK